VSSGMSGFPSVDRFLDFHREDEALVNILQLTIGKIIWEKEAASALSDSSRQSKAMELSQWWLARLLMLICDGVQKSDLECVFQHITFVIFNYDRCVEEFLFRAIQNTLALKADEAAALLSSLHVFHPYGSLGPLPWQPTAGNITSVPFGKPDPGKLALISGSLNTFTQGCQDRSVIDAIHSAIINARRLVFLGFGFLRMNLKFLSPELSLLRDLNRDVLGSAFEMPEDDRELASTFLQRRFSTSNVKLVNLRAKEVIEQHSWRLTL
ncbi:MAG: hypothetical protein J0H57_01475, partial [Rhodospirillales bacterium]|nr:hypothetical protein [Rhodospirillales bacterium]